MSAGCPADHPGSDDAGGSDTGAPESSTGGAMPSSATDTLGDTADTTAGDTGQDGDPLQVCLDLPAAAAAHWVPGPVIEPTAESSPDRIAAVGAQTWDLALTLLDLTDAAAYPSVAVSPASMTVALGMTYGRYQAGQCGQRIHEVMQFPESGDALHQTLGASVLALQSRSLPEVQGDEPIAPLRVGLSNSVWNLVQADPPNGGDAYGAQIHDVIDGDLDAINEVMNCVIEQQSDGLLVDFIPPELPAADTTTFEVNVALLQAPWTTALLERSPLSFTRDDGSTVEVDAMHNDFLPGMVYEGSGFRTIDLTLRGGELSVLFVVPTDGGTLEDFTATATADALLAARQDAMPVYFSLDMPTLDIQSETVDFYDPLQFDCEEFTLRTVLHGAAVQMDVKGVKAAAATPAESFSSGGEEVPDDAFVLNRSFLFFIYDAQTDFVLYNGRYAGEAG